MKLGPRPLVLLELFLPELHCAVKDQQHLSRKIDVDDCVTELVGVGPVALGKRQVDLGVAFRVHHTIQSEIRFLENPFY